MEKQQTGSMRSFPSVSQNNFLDDDSVRSIIISARAVLGQKQY